MLRLRWLAILVLVNPWFSIPSIVPVVVSCNGPVEKLLMPIICANNCTISRTKCPPPPAKRARTQYARKDPKDSMWYKDYVDVGPAHPVRDPESKQGRAFRRRFRVPHAIFEVMVADSVSWFPEHGPGTHHLIKFWNAFVGLL